MGIKTLLVDDEEDLLDLMAGELESVGFDVTKATSGTSAMELIRNNGYDLIVVDYRIDGPNGLDLVEAARKSKANKESILWVMTGAADPDFVTRIVEAEVDLFLQKPINLDELRNCLIDAFPQVHTV